VRAGTSRLTWRNEDDKAHLFESATSIRLAKARRLYEPDTRVFEVWEKPARGHIGT
jgi:hypothetical protein